MEKLVLRHSRIVRPREIVKPSKFRAHIKKVFKGLRLKDSPIKLPVEVVGRGPAVGFDYMWKEKLASGCYRTLPTRSGY